MPCSNAAKTQKPLLSPHQTCFQTVLSSSFCCQLVQAYKTRRLHKWTKQNHLYAANLFFSEHVHRQDVLICQAFHVQCWTDAVRSDDSVFCHHLRLSRSSSSGSVGWDTWTTDEGRVWHNTWWWNIHRHHMLITFSIKQQQQRPCYGPLSGTTRVSRYQKKHSPTHHPYHHPIFISFFHLLWSIASSLFKLRAWQSFCTSSLVYLLVWSPPPHIPYISSPNLCLLFATYTHTIPTYFALEPRLYHLIPNLSLNSLPGTLSFTLTLHIQSIWPFSSLLDEVPPHFLSWHARSHFHVAYHFAHNSLS